MGVGTVQLNNHDGAERSPKEEFCSYPQKRKAVSVKLKQPFVSVCISILNSCSSLSLV